MERDLAIECECFRSLLYKGSVLRVYVHKADKSEYNVYFSHKDANFTSLGGKVVEGDIAGAPDSDGVLP